MLRLAFQARMGIAIATQRNLDRDRPVELDVARHVHLAHAAGGQRAIDPVVPDHPSRHRDRRLLDERTGSFVRRQKALDLGAYIALVTARCI